jgi:hypothetical protein
MKINLRTNLKQWALVALLALAAACSSSDEPSPAPVPPTPTPQSSAKVLTGLQFTQVNNPSLTATYIALIDEVAKTAKLVFPNGTNVNAVVPTFTVSEKATLKIGNDLQTSNSSTWNLLGPLTLTVTAENGTSQTYVLTTVVSPPSDPFVADATAYFGKPIYKSDFPISKLRDRSFEDEIDAHSGPINAADLGRSPGSAVVLLVFDKITGLLYTPTRYNNQFNTTAIVSTDGIEEFFTELTTYKQITRVIQATSEYAQAMQPQAAAYPLWIFDAYTSSFETHVSKEAAITAKVASLPDGNDFSGSTPPWAELSNILYTSSPSGDEYLTSHIYGITQETVPGTLPFLPDQRQNTLMSEAFFTGLRTTYVFLPDNLYVNRASFHLSGITSENKTKVANFLTTEVAKNKGFDSFYLALSTYSRQRTDHYYGTKFLWHGYMSIGQNIDKNGGSIIFFDDIILNPIFMGVKF